jgi:hypothetical protein
MLLVLFPAQHVARAVVQLAAGMLTWQICGPSNPVMLRISMAVRGSHTGPAFGQLVDGPVQPEAVEVIVCMVQVKCGSDIRIQDKVGQSQGDCPQNVEAGPIDIVLVTTTLYHHMMLLVYPSRSSGL